jgi:Protein of unknown function (DUF3300)
MNPLAFRRLFGALLVCFLAGHLGGTRQAWAQQTFTADQLDKLLAPIALYPDPLLAQMLPAATYVDQIQQAARFVSQNSNPAAIDQQNWDMSVKSIAHYPEVVKRMNSDLNWTTQLGQAVYSQQKEVLQSIQRLRARARAAGTLQTSSQQTVIVDGSVIKIVPAQPSVIYVPTYDPQVVYVKEDNSGDAAAAALITFGVGLAIGSWMSSSCDWNHWGVYYGGRPVYYNRTVMNRTVVRSVSYPTWSGRTVTRGAAYNNATGRVTRGGATYNPYTGRSSAAERSYNSWTGRSTAGGVTSGPGTGTTAAGVSHNAYTGRTSAASAHYNPYTGNVSATAATRNPRTGQVRVTHRR